MSNDLPKWPLYILSLIIVLSIDFIQGCQDKKEDERYWREIEERNSSWQEKDTFTQENIIVSKDSIDVLIEQRATQELKTSIFAGLNFGDSPQIVEKQLNNNKFRKIQVPDGDKVSIVDVDSYDAEYYNGKLASLTLYAEKDELYNALETLYTTKYGKTKRGEWHFSNCEVLIEYGSRLPYRPSWDKGYNASNYGNYYDSFRGIRGSAITKDGSFLKIIYNHYEFVSKLERQRIEADSLENIKRLREREAEIELAKKLSTEPASGI